MKELRLDKKLWGPRVRALPGRARWGPGAAALLLCGAGVLQADGPAPAVQVWEAPADGAAGGAALAASAALPAASAAVSAASAASAAGAASAPQAAASAPAAHSESQGFAVHWQSPPNRAADDGVQVQRDGWRGMRVLVTSSSGRGRVELRPLRGGWPSRVQLRFQYAPDKPFDTLEGLRLQVLNPAHQAGDEAPPLMPDGFGVWQREEGLWLDLPQGWLHGGQGLRVMWVDRYLP